MTAKSITKTQLLEIATVLGLDFTWLQEIRITTDEATVTYLDPDAGKGGLIVQHVHTYQVDRSK